MYRPTRELKAAGVEEHQIAGLQFVDAHRVADPRLIARGSRERHPRSLLEYVANEAAAIEPLFGRIAAKLVVHANE